MNTDIKILLICDSGIIKEQILQQISNVYPGVQVIAPKEVKNEIDRISPNIVLLVEPEDNTGVEMVEYVRTEVGESYAPIILYIAYKQNFLLLRDLVRAGVADYFLFPDEITNFNERLERIVEVVKEQKETQAQVAGRGQVFKKGKGQIHTFFSGKGGVGRSLLATLFAQTMKFESTADVLLIDLNLQYGGVETFLGIESTRSVADIEPVIEELNETHIYNVVVKEPFSKLDLLLSPQDAEVAERITEDFVIRLLRNCRRAYDFVIVDLPSHMDSMVHAVLEESDVINYVITLDTPSMHVYKNTWKLFKRLGMDTEGRLQIVVNGVDKYNELSTGDVKEFVLAPITAEVRNDPKGVLSQINKGEPLRKDMKEKKLPLAARDVRKWVLSILK